MPSRSRPWSPGRPGRRRTLTPPGNSCCSTQVTIAPMAHQPTQSRSTSMHASMWPKRQHIRSSMQPCACSLPHRRRVACSAGTRRHSNGRAFPALAGAFNQRAACPRQLRSTSRCESIISCFPTARGSTSRTRMMRATCSPSAPRRAGRHVYRCPSKSRMGVRRASRSTESSSICVPVAILTTGSPDCPSAWTIPARTIACDCG